MPKQKDISYCDIHVHPKPMQGTRLSSGPVVYAEAFVEGQLAGRYWSACGMVKPEMHMLPNDLRDATTQFPMRSFRLGIEGEELNDGWQWLGAKEEKDSSGLRCEDGKARMAVATLLHSKRPIEVRVCTRLDGGDWLVRWLEIKNTGKKATAISSMSPMSGQLWQHRFDEHMPPDAPSPFELAYYHSNWWGQEGDMYCDPLLPGIKTFNNELKGKSGWSRPAFWTRNLANGQTFAVEFAWTGNWQFELDCRMDYAKKQARLFFAIGLAPLEGEMLRVIEPGEILRTPAVHIGHFQTDADSIVQSLHRHVRHAVMPKPPKGKDIEIEANHRGYLCDRENEPDLKRDIDIAASIGAEMYVIDAGWYGNEPNRWWLNTGDWFAGAWLPNGLESVVDHAHKRGIRFGLWVEIEAMGSNSTLRKEHPDWAVSRDGKPTVDGRALDLANPEVAKWVKSEIERIIRQYKLDMFRIDHNHDIGLGTKRNYMGFVENTLWRYYENLYVIFDKIRSMFPNVVFQNCAGGGGRLDLGMLQRFHNTELSDWMRQPRGLLLLNGLTMALPPEIGLRTFGTESGEHVLDADVDAQLRLAFLARPIFRGIAPSLNEFSPYLRERIMHHVELYKSFIRPVLRDCLVYHHTPWLPTKSQTPWCVLEYASPDKTKAVAGVFRLLGEKGDTCRFIPRGLDRTKDYNITYDNTGEIVKRSGQDLTDNGLNVRLGNIMSSEMLMFEAIEEKKQKR